MAAEGRNAPIRDHGEQRTRLAGAALATDRPVSALSRPTAAGVMQVHRGARGGSQARCRNELAHAQPESQAGASTHRGSSRSHIRPTARRAAPSSRAQAAQASPATAERGRLWQRQTAAISAGTSEPNRASAPNGWPQPGSCECVAWPRWSWCVRQLVGQPPEVPLLGRQLACRPISGATNSSRPRQNPVGAYREF